MASAASSGLFGWWHEGDEAAHKALIAASLGWMLDAFDVMLYALVLKSLMADLHLDSSTAGWVGSVTLLAAAAGGLMFGVLADRVGRTRALMLSVLLYSIFTAACGFAQSAMQLALFRIFLGIGMGGEWASGAALVSETWPDRVRGRALGFSYMKVDPALDEVSAVRWYRELLQGFVAAEASLSATLGSS